MPADRLLHPRLGHSEKVCGLSDLEFRVWLTYQLASDDYGVMRLSALTVQAANDALASRPLAQIQKALERLVTVGLITKFEHQGRAYCCQRDWQNFQRVKHPRDTMQPAPTAEILATFSAATQKLFSEHPSTRAEGFPKDVGNISETDQKPLSESGSLACARTRETANGLRLMANGSLEERKEIAEIDLSLPGPDQWARELVNLYPAQARCAAHLIERPLVAALAECPDNRPDVAWEGLKARLEQHKRSHQWRVKGMIPRLDKWLREGLHLQELPEQPPDALVSTKTSKTLAAAANILRGHS